MVFIINRTGRPSYAYMEVADTFLKRFKGLMLRNEAKEPMMFLKCRQVHTFFMKFPINVYYFDKDMKIIHIEENLTPWKIGKYVKNAYGLIEADASVESFLSIGDTLT